MIFTICTLHGSHLHVKRSDKTKQTASNDDQEVRRWVENGLKNCTLCQMFASKVTKEPITPLKVPKTWQDLSMDLFGPISDKTHILVALDTLKRFPTAKTVSSAAAQPVISALNNIYADYGIPQTHRTDNWSTIQLSSLPRIFQHSWNRTQYYLSAALTKQPC